MDGADAADPLVLQAKEAQRSVLADYVGARVGPHANQGERVVHGQRLTQMTSDIFLGWQRVTGIDGRDRDFYVRQLRDGKGSVVVEELDPAGDGVLRPAVRPDPGPGARAGPGIGWRSPPIWAARTCSTPRSPTTRWPTPSRTNADHAALRRAATRAGSRTRGDLTVRRQSGRDHTVAGPQPQASRREAIGVARRGLGDRLPVDRPVRLRQRPADPVPAPRDDLGGDRDRRLLRGSRAQIQPDRGRQPAELGVGQAGLAAAGRAGRDGCPATPSRRRRRPAAAARRPAPGTSNFGSWVSTQITVRPSSAPASTWARRYRCGQSTITSSASGNRLPVANTGRASQTVTR